MDKRFLRQGMSWMLLFTLGLWSAGCSYDNSSAAVDLHGQRGALTQGAIM